LDSQPALCLLLPSDSQPSESSATESAAALRQLETLVAKGGRFLIVPSTAFGWLDSHDEFRQYLERCYRVVVHEEQVCKIFSLQELLEDPLRSRGAPDGLPFPPPEMLCLVAGVFDAGRFYWGGVLGARCIKGILQVNGLDIGQFRAILDFGCGCGRIMRHWKALRGPQLCGTDYNPYLVDWCRRSLPFAEFSVNELASRLSYEDQQFDFIYTISIFTHLDEPLQAFWMEELTRVLTPGGFLFLTVHGTTRAPELAPEDRQRFDNGELVVCGQARVGSNACSAYHPEQYVRQTLAKGLTVVDFVPGGAKDANQDVYLLQKPLGGES
jgi:2-polyprenyl-3-methyl-5-hydroxy-6-metoxy-1,4-benzoquinol methylase